MFQKSLALFDLDYTLYKGPKYRHVILDFPYFLHANNLFPEEILKKMKKEYEDYSVKKIIGRKVFADNEIQLYYEGVKGQTVKDIEEAAKQWLIESNDLWYDYTFELIGLMRLVRIPTIIISGSPIEPLKLIKKALGVDTVYATEGEVDDQGIFTGLCKVEFANAEAKYHLIQTLDLDPNFSFAFGDSESDYPLLEAVKPNNSFLFRDVEDKTSSEAIAKGWQVHRRDIKVIETVKNRIGKLL